MKTEQMITGKSKGSALPAVAASRNIVLLGIVLALILCLGAWGAHAADPQPDNPNTSLKATAVDEAVVAVVADHAYVTVDGQVVTGTGFKTPIGKQLVFDVAAEDGYTVTDVSVAEIDGTLLGYSNDGSTYAVDAADVVNGLTITVVTATSDHVNAGRTEDDDPSATPAGQPISATVAVAEQALVYDGTDQPVQLVLLDENGAELEGYFAMDGPTVKDATNGPVAIECTRAVIRDIDGNDVTDQFSLTFQAGNVTVDPAVITIATELSEPNRTQTAVYGETLTSNVDFAMPFIEELEQIDIQPATLTEIGHIVSKPTIDWNGVNSANYLVEEDLGWLEITPVDAEIVIKALNAEREYDGTPLVGTEYELQAPSRYHAEVTLSGSQTDAGSSKCTVASYKILDELGNDVTDTFASIQTVAGTLTVKPRTLSISTPGDSKAYDGTPLTAYSSEWIHGFVTGETATATITGSQTQVGSSPNTYSIVWDGTAKQSNYSIKDTLGTLEVYAAAAATTQQQTTQTTQTTTVNSTAPAVEPAPVVVEEIIYETVYVDEPAQTYTAVEDTPAVVYATESASAQEETPASPLQAMTDVIEDVVSTVTTGTTGDSSEASKPKEEILDDDATPLAGIEKVDSPPVAPWIILGIILLAVIGALFAILFGKRNKKDQEQKA